MAIIKSYTSLEQSKKLAEILPIESADMFWLVLGNTPRVHVLTEPLSNYSQWESYPCWSLAALLDVLPKGDYKDTNLCYGGLTINDYVNEWFCSYQQPEPMVMLHTHADNPVDACVELIEKLHEQKLL